MRSRAYRARKYPRIYPGPSLILPSMENACEGGAMECQPAAGAENPLWRLEKKPRGNADSGETGNPPCGRNARTDNSSPD